MAIDPRIEASLKSAGQIGVSAINRSLYGLDNLSSAITQANTLNVPDVQGISYQGFSDLSGNQKVYFDKSSQIIADNTNNTINSLESSLKNKILPQIFSNAQDSAIISGQISGDLGLAPLDSSRNLSFISNAQAVGQQQILASVNEFSQNLTNAVTAGQTNQVSLLGQANQAEMANKQFQFSKDQFMTQVKGTLFNNGQDTGQETLSLRNQIFNEDRALGQETGNVFNRGINTGQETLALRSQIFSQDRALGQETGSVYNRGINTGRDTFAKDQFDFNSDLSNRQFALSQDQLQLNKDQFITGAIGDLTLDGRSQNRETLAKQDLMSNLATRTQNAELLGLQINDYKLNIEKSKAELAEFQTNDNPDKLKNLVEKYGESANLYWGIGKNEKGETILNYQDDTLGTKGLFLNVDFEKQGYKDIVKRTGTKDGDTPEARLSNDIMGAIQNGKATEALNKIGIQSDDGSKVLMAIKSINSKGETGYTFKDIDTSKLSLDQKAKMNNELGNLSTKSPTLLQDSDNVIKKYTQYSDITSIGFMNRLNDTQFNQGGNKSMTRTLPNNRQLMAAIIGSGKGNTINNLASKNIIQINKDGSGFNFEPLQNMYNTNAQIKLNDYAENNFANFANKSNSDSLANTLVQHYYNTENNTKTNNGTKTQQQIPTETYNFLKSLKETNQIINNQFQDKNSPYAGDLFKSFTMGSLGLSEPQANGLYQVIKKIN